MSSVSCQSCFAINRPTCDTRCSAVVYRITALSASHVCPCPTR